MELSPRLRAIAGFVPDGSCIADIGTDHGFLPVYLISNHISKSAIATDINKKPLKSAEANVQKSGLEDKIALRLGNGLEPIHEDEIDTAIIAGMGGATIRNILVAGIDKISSIKRLILQPMGDACQLRIWLAHNGWRILDEDIILDDDRFYEIICAERGYEDERDHNIQSIGPRLFEKRHPLLIELVSAEKQKNMTIIESLNKSKRELVQAKISDYMERNQFLEWVLNVIKVSNHY